jgi:N-acetyl-S-(2-succino)cysteine monooxygenase
MTGDQPRRRMSLSVFLASDPHYHIAGWRHPDAWDDFSYSLDRWVELAKMLEGACIDMLFMADSLSPFGVGHPESFVRTSRMAGFEPLTLLSALAAQTHHIGLAATAATTYFEPYLVARMFASIDHLSNGRAAWNLVTGGNPEDALNFGNGQPMPHGDRYKRAEEFADVVTGLWDTYAEDAFLRDRENGVYLDPQGYQLLRHEGERFKVRGPLSVPRSPQGRPVIIQAGASDPAREMAARVADISFAGSTSLLEAQAFYADIKSRMARFGREPLDLKVMPGATIYIGRSTAEAEEKLERLQSLVSDEVAIRQLSTYLGVDLSAYDPDAPMPDLAGNASRMSGPPQLSALSQRDGLSLREVALRAAAARTHLIVCGTAAEVADRLQEWFEGGAADGFNILPSTIPGGIEDLVHHLVPELQRRGLFRTSYEGTTLRDRLGFKRPMRQTTS